MTDVKRLGPVIESIRKIGFAANPLSAIDFSTFPQINNNISFHFTQPPTDEETEKEEKKLPPIDLTNYEEAVTSRLVSIYRS
jgi:hypothetical protein